MRCWGMLLLGPALFAGAAATKIPVWVEKAAGGYHTDVPAKQFQMLVEDKQVPIRAVLRPSDNLVLLVVLDLTGDLARVNALRGALPDALRELGPRHYVGLMRAQDGLTVLEDPTPDRAAIIERVENLAIGGKAGLLDTIEPVANIASGILRNAAVRVAVLYITDSMIGNYRADYTNPVINTSDRRDLSRRFPDRLIQDRTMQLVSALESCQAPIFILHLEHGTGPLSESYQNGLKKMAEATAGAAVFCRTPAEIGPSLEQMVVRIRSGYTLVLDPLDRSRRPLRIRVTAGGTERLSFRSRLAVR